MFEILSDLPLQQESRWFRRHVGAKLPSHFPDIVGEKHVFTVPALSTFHLYCAQKKGRGLSWFNANCSVIGRPGFVEHKICSGKTPALSSRCCFMVLPHKPVTKTFRPLVSIAVARDFHPFGRFHWHLCCFPLIRNTTNVHAERII